MPEHASHIMPIGVGCSSCRNLFDELRQAKKRISDLELILKEFDQQDLNWLIGLCKYVARRREEIRHADQSNAARCADAVEASA